jgi:hypothetical protein
MGALLTLWMKLLGLGLKFKGSSVVVAAAPALISLSI